MLNELISELNHLTNSEQAEKLSRYFKTGKGEYGEGDIFLGLKTAQIHEIANKYKSIELKELKKLLDSSVHEHRSVALGILKHQFKDNPKDIFDFYLNNRQNINNWDLVDISAPNIIGNFLLDKDRKVLYDLVKGNLWDKRIAIISTYTFIRNNQFDDTLKIAELLLTDKHDLIHKAVGWMLREVGKKNLDVLELFLKTRYKEMPRTMLRYAIEKFPEEKRQLILKGKW